MRAWQPLPVSLPGESMDRGAWWSTVHGVAKSSMQLSDLALLHTYTYSWCTLLYNRNEYNIVKQLRMCMRYIPIKTNFKKAMWWSKLRVQEYFVVLSGHVPEKLYTSIYQANPFWIHFIISESVYLHCRLTYHWSMETTSTLVYSFY